MLSASEAAARLAFEGYNDLPSTERHSPLAILLEVVREPMFGLLLGAAVLYAIIGDLGEALLLFAFATLSVSIALVQRSRSERVLEALRDLTSPRALVVRDDQRQRIPGREVVRGDLLIVTEGDRVPADAVLVAGEDLRVDESLLTGESVPVQKRPAPVAVEPRGDHLSLLYSGTLVLGGTGHAVVTATGIRSEIGKIGSSLGAIESGPSRLQQQTRRLVVIFATAGIFLSTLVVLLYGFLRGDWLQAVLGGIALGMAMLPEEFPLVLTVFMVMGAWRLSQSRVLTRRAAAIEALGAATVLCTDKTGTLTRNTMSVVHLQCGAEQWRAGDAAAEIAGSGKLGELLGTALAASEPEALDPMERALFDLAAQAQAGPATTGSRVRAYPLRRELLAVTNVWALPGEADYLAATKGAPEAIARLCRMNPTQHAELIASVDTLARQGIRVLAVARGQHARGSLPDSPFGLSFEFAGLLGLADPLRESVPEAVRDCRSAGIRVVMITGDYPETARAIAREAGIADGDVLTGQDLEQLDDGALSRRARHATVFARITPRQKLRIVEALKASDEIVAMTGDGVNDAPALKAAHIGIAMGGRGTDVAREASSIVLLDDDFGSIVEAIRLGRRIYDNLRKAMGYILAIHLPIAGLALLPVLLGGPLILTPLLIAFLELIIDPACSIVLEAQRAEQNVMRRPPRHPASPLFSRALASWSILQGTLALLIVTAIYLYATRKGLPQEDVRSVAFVALAGMNLALVFVNRTFRVSLRATLGEPNAPLWWGLALVVGILTVLLAWPAARAFLGLGALQLSDLVPGLAAPIVLFVILQLLKRAWVPRLAT